MSKQYLCAAVSPPANFQLDDNVISGEEADPQEVEVLEEASDHAEVELMEKALSEGTGYDKGASISGGTLCGPAEDGNPLAQKPIMLPSPMEPTQKEIDQHNLTHLPYMSWCPHCVSTRRPNVAHRSRSAESSLPLLALDYCYIRDTVGQDFNNGACGASVSMAHVLCHGGRYEGSR